MPGTKATTVELKKSVTDSGETGYSLYTHYKSASAEWKTDYQVSLILNLQQNVSKQRVP